MENEIPHVNNIAACNFNIVDIQFHPQIYKLKNYVKLLNIKWQLF